jgi:hypothetical protein
MAISFSNTTCRNITTTTNNNREKAIGFSANKSENKPHSNFSIGTAVAISCPVILTGLTGALAFIVTKNIPIINHKAKLIAGAIALITALRTIPDAIFKARASMKKANSCDKSPEKKEVANSAKETKEESKDTEKPKTSVDK